MLYKKSLTKEQALQKLRHYCGYQERCHSEVREKLFRLGTKRADRDEIIASLIEEGYLNEERYAIAYAGGRFRIKKWGKEKIRFELKKKQVSEYCIKKAMEEIDDSDYAKSIQKLYREKWSAPGMPDDLVLRRRQTVDYLVQKGYERGLVLESTKEHSSAIQSGRKSKSNDRN